MHQSIILKILAVFLSTFFTEARVAVVVAEEVDLELVLAVDVSGSVSMDLVDRQQTAFAAAFRTEELQNAILSGPNQKIAVVYFEYSSFGKQRVVVPWTVLSEADEILRFARMLERPSAFQLGGETSISSAMQFAQYLFTNNGHRSLRKVLDITGNGPNNDGLPVSSTLLDLQALGVTVNGLILPGSRWDRAGPFDALFPPYEGLPLRAYFEKEVIGGHGAFAISVDDADSYVDAILRKLILEVAWYEDTEVMP